MGINADLYGHVLMAITSVPKLDRGAQKAVVVERTSCPGKAMSCGGGAIPKLDDDFIARSKHFANLHWIPMSHIAVYLLFKQRRVVDRNRLATFGDERHFTASWGIRDHDILEICAPSSTSRCSVFLIYARVGKVYEALWDAVVKLAIGESPSRY